MDKEEKSLIRELCLESYYDFFIEFWSEIEAEKLADNWHIEYLCSQMEEIGFRVANRQPLEHNLIINISPGETKSTISTVMFPVWIWLIDPTIRILTASYSKDLATEHSVKSRDLIRSEKFQDIFGDIFQIRKDVDGKTNYRNNKGGQRSIASVGSTITGKHAHILIVDDPLSADEAKSEVKRETANNWMGKTLSSRKTDIAITPTILIMQRLHENDPTAKQADAWGKNGQLKWVRLPADDRYIISPSELKDKYIVSGNMRVMNPYRKPEKVIKGMELEMTASEASGQLGQDPKPAEGNKLKKAWFTQRFSVAELEETARIRGHEIVWNAVLDGAYTKNTSNSATGVLVYAIYEGKIYFRDFRKWHLEFPDLVKRLPKFLLNYFSFSSMLFVEPKAIGKSLVQVIRKLGGFNIIEDELPKGITNMQSKEMRVDRSTPYLRSMNAFFSNDIDWTIFIDECIVFPNGNHDDLVDCLTMSIEKVDKAGLFDDDDLWGF